MAGLLGSVVPESQSDFFGGEDLSPAIEGLIQPLGDLVLVAGVVLLRGVACAVILLLAVFACGVGYVFHVHGFSVL